MQLPVDYTKIPQAQRRLVREEYIRVQEGNCWHCKATLAEVAPEHITSKNINKRLFPKGFFDHPVHLHHDHNTGLTIGAVHCHCNAVLWQYYGQ